MRVNDDTSPSSPAPGGSAEARLGDHLGARAAFFRDAFHALAFNGISGDYAEFGSYGGVTLWLAQGEIRRGPVARHCWAFDSFQGLPEAADERDRHRAWLPGSMAMSVDEFHATLARGGVPRDAYTAVQGFFEESLPRRGRDGEPVDIALAYVDCDLYSSTVTVLDFLEPRLKHGMLVGFDDYFCWSSDDVSGERAALSEFLDRNRRWHFERYRDIGWGGCSFVVEDRERVPSRTGGGRARA